MRCKLTNKGISKLNQRLIGLRVSEVQSIIDKDYNTIRRLREREKSCNESTIAEVFKSLGIFLESEDIQYESSRKSKAIKSAHFLVRGIKMSNLLNLSNEQINKMLNVTEKEIQKGNTVVYTRVSKSNPLKNRLCIYLSSNFPEGRILLPHNQMFGLDYSSWWRNSMSSLENLMDSLKTNITIEGYGLCTNFREDLIRPDGSRCWYLKDYLWFPGEPGICLSVGEPNNWGYIEQEPEQPHC